MEEGSIGNHPTAGGDAARRDDRDSLMVLARIRIEGEGESVPVRVRNVSSGGLMAQATDDYQPGVRVEIELEGMGRVAGSVAWAEAGRIGIAFDHPVDKQRARKPKTKPVETNPEEMLMRVTTTDFRRPPLKPR